MLLMRNLSQVRLASYQERKGMGRLRVNRILISPDFLPQDFSGISPATQAVSYRNGEFFNQRSCDLIEDGGRVVVILDFIIKMKMMVFNSCTSNSVAGFIRLPFLSL